MEAGRASGILDGEDGIEQLYAHAAAGNASALAIFGVAGRSLGDAVAGLVNVLSPQVVLVSGEGTRAWAYEWNTEARIRSEVGRSLALGIPVGVVVIEAWSDERTFVAFRDARYEIHADGEPHRLADFTFPPDGAWPDPRGLVDWLHANGLRVLLWQVPLLSTRPPLVGQPRVDRDLVVARGYGIRQADGRPYRNRGSWFPGALMPDWTNPEARAWWLERRRYLVEELGIDGFKTDGGEHAWEHPFQYLLGDDLLVAPVVEPGMTSLEVYLPEGQWVDFWTGEQIAGGRSVNREVPLETIPVYQRVAGRSAP